MEDFRCLGYSTEIPIVALHSAFQTFFPPQNKQKHPLWRSKNNDISWVRLKQVCYMEHLGRKKTHPTNPPQSPTRPPPAPVVRWRAEILRKWELTKAKSSCYKCRPAEDFFHHLSHEMRKKKRPDTFYWIYWLSNDGILISSWLMK